LVAENPDDENTRTENTGVENTGTNTHYILVFLYYLVLYFLFFSPVLLFSVLEFCRLEYTHELLAVCVFKGDNVHAWPTTNWLCLWLQRSHQTSRRCRSATQDFTSTRLR